MAQRSLPHSPQFVDGGGDDNKKEKEFASPPVAVTQDLQSEEGSQDETNAVDEEQSSTLPNFEEGTDQAT